MQCTLVRGKYITNLSRYEKFVKEYFNFKLQLTCVICHLVITFILFFVVAWTLHTYLQIKSNMPLCVTENLQ